MKCLRAYMRRNFMRYLDGELDPQSATRFENHLFDCGWCRGQVARLREGQRLVRQVPVPRPARDRWNEIEAALERDSSLPDPHHPAQSPLRRHWAAAAMALIALLLAALLIMSNRRSNETQSANMEYGDETRRFQAVSIADLPHNTRPHVVTEGYVSELRLDADGDLTFRLVEDINRPDPFIVCEIIKPIHISPPAVGSRVRVYGVSRYDGQPDKQWYEVHPVLNIEVVKR